MSTKGEVLGSHSDKARTVNTWGKYEIHETQYYYCSGCWSGIGTRVLRKAADIACTVCGRSKVRNVLKVNEAAD